jgi:hypothetical protein
MKIILLHFRSLKDKYQVLHRGLAGGLQGALEIRNWAPVNEKFHRYIKAINSMVSLVHLTHQTS